MIDLVKLKYEVDELLEGCARRRLDLKNTLALALPKVGRRIGALSAVVRTLNEDLKPETYAWGAGHGVDLSRRIAEPRVVRAKSCVWVEYPLDVGGRRIGQAAFAFAKGVDGRARLPAVRMVCEELDGAMWAIQAAAEKQKLIELLTRALTRPRFPDAIDEAVRVLRAAIPFEHLALVHIDEARLERKLHYRVYKSGRLVHEWLKKPHRELDEAIRRDGVTVLDPDRRRIARALGFPHSMESLFLYGVAGTQCLGEVVIETPHGLDAFGRDLLKVFSNAVTQRLHDYTREQARLAQFFSPDTAARLVATENYAADLLKPKVETFAILFADINGFTRLCERALVRPARIGAFVDAWSARAVEIVWKHGGVFDKMVGDCIIAEFGPPFFDGSLRARAQAAARAAFELQAYTASLGADPELAKLPAKAGLPGFGVAVGINLCKAAVGEFGPNRDYTTFGRGMNETARLQSAAGFRETFAMSSLARHLPRAGFSVDGPHEVQVKNVGEPLRYYKIAPKKG